MFQFKIMIQSYKKLVYLPTWHFYLFSKHVNLNPIKSIYLNRHVSVIHSCCWSNPKFKLRKSEQLVSSKLFLTGIYSNTYTTTHAKLNSTQNKIKNGSSNQYKRLFGLVKPEVRSISGAIMLLAISSSVTLSVPFFMGMIIDIVQKASNSGGLQEALQPLLVLLSSIFILGALANVGRIYLLQMSGQRVTKRLRENAFSSIVSQELAFFDKTRTGELISRLAADVELVSGAVTQNVSDGLRAVAQVTVGVSMMFYMSSDLAKVILVVVPPVAIASVIYGRYLRHLTSQTQQILAESSQHVEEKISSIRTVRSFAKEDSEIKLYIEKMNGVLSVAKKEAMARSGFFGLTGLSGNAIMLLVLYNGGIMMQAGQITVGDLSAFLLYSGYVAISISGLSSFYSTVNKSLGASQRLWELIDRVPSISLNQGIVPHKSILNCNIYFNQVQFAYPSRKNHKVFDKFDLTIEAGKVTAIVGLSGCGKTTIGSLLLRFYEPNIGTITIGDLDIKEINPQWIRNQIGTVFQEPTLFSASVRDNIAYGAADSDLVTFNEIVESAKKANAFDFVNQLPNGFDTELGERGVTLSGGQRQRIAIARALVKNPKILLLDEATSALDATSEHLVKDALEKLYAGRTTIIIAHRLSTIRDAHMIVVLGQDGRVKEKGNYNELMNVNDGYFKELVKKQTLLT